MSQAWWQLSVTEAVERLGTHADRGLSEVEAKQRLAQYGPNHLQEAPGASAWEIFLGQFKNTIIWVLIAAAVVSGFLGEWVDTLAILAIVVLNAILGFVQEYRAEKSLAALKKLSSPNSKVIRDGTLTTVPSSDLVPGDLVVLEAGDYVPADGRVVWVTPNFAVQEASLTGESMPASKSIDALAAGEITLGDRRNMVYLGTSVAAGKARAVIAETAMKTELGKIANMIQQVEAEITPLQQKLEEFGKWIIYICFILVGLVFALEMIRGGKMIDVFMTSVSLAVAAIPEGLPAVVTIALALGVQRMVKRHVLIRKLASVETLGCTTVICSDKTGTLTRNEMTVRVVYAGGKQYPVTGIGYSPQGQFRLDEKAIQAQNEPDLEQALRVGVLCNGAEFAWTGQSGSIVGDPTEGAILVAAAKAGMTKADEEKRNVFVDEIPFDSDRKMMTILRHTEGELTAYVKGAPDILLSRCNRLEQGDQVRAMTEADRREILRVNNELANQAMRVLAMAYRPVDANMERDSDTIETDLIFSGLVAMIDPPREEVKKAMKECQSAGIRTVMITGDHKNTAVAIAKELGFYREGSQALTGEELEKMTDEQLTAAVEQTPVYARVSPEHKLRIVKAWRNKQQVVAMTGDGVNDAPSVKEAEIGVAMGITGTDVTKEVSDMVITDDNFASIVSAVHEGRGIYDNIQKFIHYLLSCNVGEILVMLLASLAGIPVPLLPIHLLWVNLVTDGLPALALGVDPIDPDAMKRPPRSKFQRVITNERLGLMVFQGFVISICCLSAFCFAYYLEGRYSVLKALGALFTLDFETIRTILTIDESQKEMLLGRARTMAFIVLAFCQDFHSYNCRSQVRSLFEIGVLTNLKLIGATTVSIILNMSALYLPFLHKVLKTEPLTATELLIVLACASIPFWVMEIVKRLNRRRHWYTLD
ncbi:MAG: cation-translocating P-type ATPase [Phycisphaerae bacterium]|nr:cation-translocating P-type ATPase [Phycisphaerae bacterium]